MNRILQDERFYSDEPREVMFGLISRRELAWSEHKGRVIESGDDWVKIETREPIEPGYVWMRNRISGNRGGFVESSTKREGVYQAHIKITSLTWNVENYVRERARRSLAHIPLCDPAEIIAGHVDSLATDSSFPERKE